jgi:hypothetical protein
MITGSVQSWRDFHHSRAVIVLAIAVGTFAPRAPAAVRYVDVNSVSPTPPHTSWSTAATNIQDAVDVAVAGDQIVVTNGIYQTGGKAIEGETNRVAVDKPLTIQSINGPQFTVISGSGTVRCVYLTNGTLLTGFTLTNGLARHLSGGGVAFDSGIESFDSDAIVLNCVIVGNSAGFGGGAGHFRHFGRELAYVEGVGGTLNNCVLKGNWATGISLLPEIRCSGGGADNCKLNNCTLDGNSATCDRGGTGGAAAGSRLRNCTLIGNSAEPGEGGGAAHSLLINCTLTGNSASVAGGAWACRLRNSIVYGNSEPNWDFFTANSEVSYSCITPLPQSGAGSITNAPLFMDQAAGNLRLQTNSPCINSGYNGNVPAGPDLDGNGRVSGGTVDIGAYEFQSPASVMSYAWLQQYGFASDGSVDYSDSDGDLMNNWQEWIAGTGPTNSLSVLRLLNPTNGMSGVTVSWQSVSNRTYFLERASNLGGQPPFLLLKTNIVGQANVTHYTDTDAIGGDALFYRIGVQQ